MRKTTDVGVPRELFEAWTKTHPADWDLRCFYVNGEFHHYFDPDTDNAWLGFQAALAAAPTPPSADSAQDVGELVAALEVYADACDATETHPCGYTGNMCCMTARTAIAAYKRSTTDGKS